MRRASARQLSAGEAAQLLGSASAVMGRRYEPGTQYVLQALGCAAERVAEGSTLADLVEVCRLASARWAGGDHWPPLRNLTYLWGASLPAILAGGAGGGGRGPSAPVHRAGEDLEDWRRGLRAEPDQLDPLILLREDKGEYGAVNQNQGEGAR